MTVAYVKNADGSGGLVQNTFKDSAGALHTLTNFYTDDAGVPHQVFFEYLPTTTPANKGRIFRATDSRVFNATDQRTFNV
jgi:hypothetical protein